GERWTRTTPRPSWLKPFQPPHLRSAWVLISSFDRQRQDEGLHSRLSPGACPLRSAASRRGEIRPPFTESPHKHLACPAAVFTTPLSGPRTLLRGCLSWPCEQDNARTRSPPGTGLGAPALVAPRAVRVRRHAHPRPPQRPLRAPRSEEHTSELQ